MRENTRRTGSSIRIIPAALGVIAFILAMLAPVGPRAVADPAPTPIGGVQVVTPASPDGFVNPSDGLFAPGDGLDPTGVTAAGFSPNGRRLWIAGEFGADTKISVYDADSGGRTGEYRWAGRLAGPDAVLLPDRGEPLALTVDDTGGIILHSGDDGSGMDGLLVDSGESASFAGPDPDRPLILADSITGATLQYVEKDGTQTPVDGVPADAEPLGAASDGRLIMTSGATAAPFGAYDTRRLSVIAVDPDAGGAETLIPSVDCDRILLSDDRIVTYELHDAGTGEYDRTLSTWSAVDGGMLSRLDLGSSDGTGSDMKADGGTIVILQDAPVGRIAGLTSVSIDGETLRITADAALQAHSFRIAALSPSGRYAYLSDPTVMDAVDVYDTKDMSLRAVLDPQTGDANATNPMQAAVIISPDASRGLIIGCDRRARPFDTGERIDIPESADGGERESADAPAPADDGGDFTVFGMDPILFVVIGLLFAATLALVAWLSIRSRRLAERGREGARNGGGTPAAPQPAPDTPRPMPSAPPHPAPPHPAPQPVPQWPAIPVCPGCGLAYPVDASFCPRCGRRLAGGAMPDLKEDEGRK